MLFSFVEDCEADVDGDGICDDVDDCVGVYDECGVCKGPGAISSEDALMSQRKTVTVTVTS